MANLTSLLNQLPRERKRLQDQLDNVSKALAPLGKKRKTRKLSASAIARISAAQKQRWAKWRKQQKAA